MQRFLFGASGAVLALAAMPVAAQTAPEAHTATVQDIVVTAQRREQSSQDVGIALSVIGGQNLDEKGVNVINDIENVVPNMEVDSQFGSGQPSFRIRGIGTREYSSNNASTVGIYVDEVAHPYTITTQGAMFDIARLEVLRGPQGTLYGRNTTGGAVNIITNAPTVDARAGFSAEYGSYDRYKVEGYISGQIAPGLLGRLAAVTEQGGAWQYHRITGEKLGDRDKTALRGRLTWDASQDVMVDLSATYSIDKSDGLGFRLRAPYPVVLSGDYHSFWTNDVKRVSADPSSATVAAEFVGTSISSSGPPYDSLMSNMPNNPQIKFFDSRVRGYMSMDITPRLMTTRYQAISDVRDPRATLSTLNTWAVEDGRPGAQLT